MTIVQVTSFEKETIHGDCHFVVELIEIFFKPIDLLVEVDFHRSRESG